MENNNEVSQIMVSYLEGVRGAIQMLPFADIEKVLLRLEEAREEGQRVFICGNGGSAVTASHFAADLQKGVMRDGRPAIDTECLCDNIARFTAWANDTSYDNVFIGTMKAKITPGSVLIAISGSGNSSNVLNAVKVARDLGATTIGFAGFNGGKLKDLVDMCIVVRNFSMEQIEDVHLVLCHLLTYSLRNMRVIKPISLGELR